MIESARNPRIVAAVRLRRARNRREEGRSLLEGPHVLEAALAGGAAIEQVFFAGSESIPSMRSGIEWFETSEDVLRRLAPTEHPRGPVAVFRIPPVVDPVAAPSLVLWGVSDPGNAGTLIRSAAAFGCQVVVVPGTVDVWSPKVVRAAAGAHFGVRLAALPAASLDGLRSAGCTPVATVVSGGEPLDGMSWPDRPALLVGEEARGLPAEVVAACERRVTIPMAAGTESLNAAVAGSIALYEMRRRR